MCIFAFYLVKMRITPNDKRNYEGVNFDFILALKDVDDVIEKHFIPIKNNRKMVNDFFRMLEDESSDADDIYYSFKRCYSNCGSFDYCLGFGSLTSSYIDPITYPIFNESNYRLQAEEYKKRISLAKNETIRDLRQKEFNKWNHRQKQNIIEKCLPYIFACNYHDSLESNEIEKNYLIYSNETHGRFSYTRKVNDDIEIVLKTNFCYGRSSSMMVIITYKGIPILPYSIWVRYFYAGYNEILRCTRSYNPERVNWNTCLDFVIWFVEKAIENPELFVKETIMQEVNGLLNGIEEMYKLTDEEMKQKMLPSCPDESLKEKYYIGIKSARMATGNDAQYYTIAPEEAKLVYRMEKITGALHFLKSLRQLSEIYDRIDQSINRIKEINALFYPEIANAIPPVIVYIAGLNETLKPIEKRFNVVQKRFDYLYNKLQKRLERVDEDKKDKVRELFKMKNPQYEKLSYEVIELERQVDTLKTQISNREIYLQKLEEAQFLVRRHVVAVNL